MIGAIRDHVYREVSLKYDEYPALYRSASEISQKYQRSFYRVFFGHMALLVIATAISVINSATVLSAVVQALVLVGALGFAIYLSLVRPEKHWYSGRAVAESIKTTTWRYVSRAEPYNHDDEVDKHQFQQNLKAIIEQNRDVATLLTTHLDDVQVSEHMQFCRTQELSKRQAYYHKHRIQDQQSWYAIKAAYNRRMANRFLLLLIVAIICAIVSAIVKVAYPTANYWPTDIFVVLAASVLSWIQAKRFQELSASYSLTAHEISLIREQESNSMNDASFSSFVGDAESAFSREHTQWIARKGS